MHFLMAGEIQGYVGPESDHIPYRVCQMLISRKLKTWKLKKVVYTKHVLRCKTKWIDNIRREIGRHFLGDWPNFLEHIRI